MQYFDLRVDRRSVPGCCSFNDPDLSFLRIEPKQILIGITRGGVGPHGIRCFDAGDRGDRAVNGAGDFDGCRFGRRIVWFGLKKRTNVVSGNVGIAARPEDVRVNWHEMVINPQKAAQAPTPRMESFANCMKD